MYYLSYMSDISYLAPFDAALTMDYISLKVHI
jgi:hypothetical protein